MKAIATVLVTLTIIACNMLSLEGQNKGQTTGSGITRKGIPISSADELRDINLDGDYHLTQDITITGNWTPLGSQNDPFTGTLDGNWKKISGLKIDQGENIGLFGTIGKNGKVENLVIDTPSVKGNQYVGALAGKNIKGTISNVQITGGDIKGTNNVGGLVGINKERGTITNSYTTGSVNGTDDVGGLVGDNSNNGTIKKSYSEAIVTGSNAIGGLVGFNNSTISNSYATGPVKGNKNVGGLVGSNAGTITNSYATGSVTETGNNANDIGGFVGYNNDDATIKNNYFDKNTTKQHNGVGNDNLHKGVTKYASDTNKIVKKIDTNSTTLTEAITKSDFPNWDFDSTPSIWNWLGNGKWPTLK